MNKITTCIAILLILSANNLAAQNFTFIKPGEEADGPRDNCNWLYNEISGFGHALNLGDLKATELKKFVRYEIYIEVKSSESELSGICSNGYLEENVLFGPYFMEGVDPSIVIPRFHYLLPFEGAGLNISALLKENEEYIEVATFFLPAHQYNSFEVELTCDFDLTFPCILEASPKEITERSFVVNNSLEIYPNPSNGYIEIKNIPLKFGHNSQFYIHDNFGKEVYKKRSENLSEKLSLENILDNGHYFISLVDVEGNVVFIERIVILK